jgi:transcriptional regulator with XRE-family HTH domain
MVQTQMVNTTKIVEPLKERSNMVKARKNAHLSQKDVAEKMQVTVKSVNNWEKARTDPRHYQIDELREAIKFTGTDKELLQVFTVEQPTQDPQETSEPHAPPCHQEAVHDTMNSSECDLRSLVLSGA